MLDMPQDNATALVPLGPAARNDGSRDSESLRWQRPGRQLAHWHTRTATAFAAMDGSLPASLRSWLGWKTGYPKYCTP